MNEEEVNNTEETEFSEMIESSGIDPAEVQKELEDLVRSKFGDKVKIVTQPIGFDPLDPDLNMGKESTAKDSEKQIKESINLEFNLKPKEVFSYLSEFVIGQEEAKKTLSIAICDHYNHIKKVQGGESKLEHYYKQNVLMLGPTGVGKTYLIKKLAQLVGVPFVKADATKFTEAGYVGANVDDTIRDLITQASGDVELAQYGIVYIDEADKLAGSRRVAGKDISGRGVQNGMLKLLEDTDIETSSPFDMMAQMNSMMAGGKSKKPKTINTKNILFIFSGAFNGLEDIIKKRMNVNTIGLSRKSKRTAEDNGENIFSKAITKDLMDFGLEPELIGRLPVRVHLNDLTEDDLFKILTQSKESILYQYQDAFESYGIDLSFEDEALRSISKLAFSEKTGARSLMTIIEKILRDYKFEMPSIEISKLKVSEELVKDSPEFLKKLILENTRLT